MATSGRVAAGVGNANFRQLIPLAIDIRRPVGQGNHGR